MSFQLSHYPLFMGALIILSTINCASKPETALPGIPVAKTAKQEIEIPIGKSWEVEWERILFLAKKEGKIVIYGTFDPSVRTMIVKTLKEKFGLDAEIVVGRGAEMARKLLSERNAGIYNADVYVGGGNTIFNEFLPANILDPLEPLIFLPDIMDTKNWFNGEILFLDKEKRALVMFGFPSNPMVINTNLVRKDEIKSYEGMVNPKWKGLIVMLDPTTAGFGLNLFRTLAFKFLGLDYWREMIKQDLVIVGDQRQLVEFVARGKMAIGLAPSSGIVRNFQEAGAPIKRIVPPASASQSGLNAGSGIVAYINRAPHHNASRLFMNWLLGREGQTLYSKATTYQSRRLDVPTDHVAPEDIRQPGIKYFAEDDIEWMKTQPEHLKIAKEFFAPLLSR